MANEVDGPVADGPSADTGLVWSLTDVKVDEWLAYVADGDDTGKLRSVVKLGAYATSGMQCAFTGNMPVARQPF